MIGGTQERVMGDAYTVMPLTFHPELPAWLEQHGIEVPPLVMDNRYPTLREIRAVLSQMDGYGATYHAGPSGCGIDIGGTNRRGEEGYASIWIPGFCGDEDEPLAFSFHKGWCNLNLEITRRLSSICGPLVFVSHSIGVPILVTEDTDIDQAQKMAGYI
jgi:hypothetical protein